MRALNLLSLVCMSLVACVPPTGTSATGTGPGAPAYGEASEASADEAAPEAYGEAGESGGEDEGGGYGQPMMGECRTGDDCSNGEACCIAAGADVGRCGDALMCQWPR